MRTAIVLIAVGLVLLASACGGGPAVAASTGSDHLHAALAYAHCMRSHGVPTFPDPDAQGDFVPFRSGVSKQVALAADASCKHLLGSGATATPQQRRQKLAFGVKVAECMRSHGFPDFPDPTGLGENHLPADIDPNSPTFHAAETACEGRARKALGLG